ncbi:hypothetical protein HIM_05320 [Hirsutella minnesotensis 3608]|uniref:Uncharacterized protein n=1 Tax=Hirsutella minnesotensis 3608 TaxID=1043627 RepID=A0A0F8A5I6_9HYPO|nr:hypothetical protein HIM_05320 [Hirsutella minnesotensis 3608]
MGTSLLSSGSKTIPYMRMTETAIPCAVPILAKDFAYCQVPGGVELWNQNGFYSPGVCFTGYKARCTQTAPPGREWPLREQETAVRCVPAFYDCNAAGADQRFATSNFDGIVLSAPAFEIRWRGADLVRDSGAGEGEFSAFSSPSLRPFPTRTVTLQTGTDGTFLFPTAETTKTSTLESTLESPLQSPSQSSLQSPSPSPSAVVQSSHLEAGSVAGIVIGTIAIVALVVVGIVFLVLRHRSHARGRKFGSGYADGLTGDSTLQQRAVDFPVGEMEHKPMGPRELATVPGIYQSSQAYPGYPGGVLELDAIDNGLGHGSSTPMF